MLFDYDELGNLVREGLEVNGNGILDFDSYDRISETETLYKWYGNVLWRETAGYVCSGNTEAKTETRKTDWWDSDTDEVTVFEKGLTVSERVIPVFGGVAGFGRERRLTGTISPREGESHIGYHPNGMTAYEQWGEWGQTLICDLRS